MEQLLWRIYYGDGTTFDASEGSPYDAPGLNVQAIACADPDPKSNKGSYAVFRFDYYWWDVEHATWFGGDLFGLFDYLQRPGNKRVVFGRTIANALHYELIDKACNDPDVARKSKKPKQLAK